MLPPRPEPRHRRSLPALPPLGPALVPPGPGSKRTRERQTLCGDEARIPSLSQAASLFVRSLRLCVFCFPSQLSLPDGTSAPPSRRPLGPHLPSPHCPGGTTGAVAVRAHGRHRLSSPPSGPLLARPLSHLPLFLNHSPRCSADAPRLTACKSSVSLTLGLPPWGRALRPPRGQGFGALSAVWFRVVCCGAGVGRGGHRACPQRVPVLVVNE